MNASSADVITSPELRTLLESPTAPRVIDVRTPAEFETSHIAGSYNVPFDVVDEHGPAVAQRLDDEPDVVLVCRSGQRATKAQTLLRNAGLASGRVLQNGITDWERRGFAVDRGFSVGISSVRYVWSRDRSCCRRSLAASRCRGSNGWPARSGRA